MEFIIYKDYEFLLSQYRKLVSYLKLTSDKGKK